MGLIRDKRVLHLQCESLNEERRRVLMFLYATNSTPPCLCARCDMRGKMKAIFDRMRLTATCTRDACIVYGVRDVDKGR